MSATHRALVEEHVPDELRPALDLWAAEWAKKARDAAAEEAEVRASAERQDLALILESLPLSPEEIAAALRPKIGRTAAELLAEVPEEPNWVLPGLVARGWTLKIAAREKDGKGTFTTLHLGELERGEETIFGPTEPTTALIATEEPEESIREKIADAGLKRATVVFGWELAGMDWRAKVDYLVTRAVDEGHGVLFVDNVSRAAGIDDEAGTELARAVEYLSDRAKPHKLAVIIDHHHRKASGRTEDKSRGGTALAGAVDCNLEIERVGTEWNSRVRKLSCRGRVKATLWTQTIALNEDGTGYEIVANVEAPQDGRLRRRLRALRDAGDAGVDAAELAEIVGVSKEQARKDLHEMTNQGWADASDGRPRRWTISALGRDALRVEAEAAEEEANAAIGF